MKFSHLFFVTSAGNTTIRGMDPYVRSRMQQLSDFSSFSPVRSHEISRIAIISADLLTLS